jgi:hypothetical protein
MMAILGDLIFFKNSWIVFSSKFLLLLSIRMDIDMLLKLPSFSVVLSSV